MKIKVALLSLMVLVFGLAGQSIVYASSATTGVTLTSYSGVDETNYYADSVLVDSGAVYEKTTAASDSTNSLSLAKSDGSLMYIGFDEAFDGFAMDVDTSASNGSFKVTYWNGSSWDTLQSTSSTDIKNSASTGVFKITWDRPSDWDARTIAIDNNEDGDEDTSESLYFAKIEVMSDYDNAATIGRMGVIDYNLVIEMEDELGDELETSDEEFDLSSLGNETVYLAKEEGTTVYLALHSYGSTYTYTINKSGYVETDGSSTVNKERTEATLSMDFTHKILAVDADDGGNVNITSATAGDSDVDCTIHSGDAYCPVDTSDDASTATVEASNYDTESFTLPDRTSDSSSQKVTTVEMTSGGSSDEVDLTVSDLSMDDDDLIVKVENEGGTDVDSDADVYLYVYVDGDRESSYKIDTSYLDEGETLNVTFTLDALNNLDEEVEVEACVDATDDVDEDDESNNCRTEDFGSDTSDGADFEVTDIYVENDDLYYTIKNTGDTDATGTIQVETTVEQDGDEDTLATKSYSSSSSSNDFFDAGDQTTYNLGEVLEEYYDDGSDFDVTVCVDSDTDVSESDEGNNCLTVDDSELDNGGNESCGEFTDIDSHWAEEFICNLYDRDVVEGRTDTKFYPDYDITRAEFLKVALLGLDYEPYAVSGVYYDDVDSGDWYYEYVTYATAQGIVDGYDDGDFKPNQTITRAEAIVLLLRAANQEDYSFDESDIDYSDVDEDDWFAWAVVLADETDIMNGYSSTRFGPGENLTRGEAAKIVDLSYQEFIQ